MTPVEPQCLGIVFCDQLIEDRRTGKKSLIGLFNDILVSHTPVKHPRMFLVVSLTNCLGRFEFQLRFSRERELDEETLMEIGGQVEGRNPLAVMDLVFELNDLALPQPGKYLMELLRRSDGEVLAQRPLFVNVYEPPEGGASDEASAN